MTTAGAVDLSDANFEYYTTINLSAAGNSLNLSGSTADDPSYTITVNGGAAADTVTGSARADDFSRNDGADTLIGGDGNDVLVAGTGLDFLQGGDGDNRLQANSAVAVSTTSAAIWRRRVEALVPFA